ncbi:MAG: hypothetical protein EXQ56_02855 [Acidobacteria bacterium]|nr:hypothetical protein [Acidobacteriota bacterium]
MKCDEVRSLLTDFVLDEVSPHDGQSVRDHLDRCSACQHQEVEVRGMLRLLQRSEVIDEVPQRIRIAADPSLQPEARWLAAFWGNASRLVFAGGAMACLAVGLLGIFQARLSYAEGRIEVAFGPQPEIGPTPSLVQVTEYPMPASAGTQLTRQDVVNLITQSSQASEVRLQQNAQKLIQAVALKADERRATDLQDMAATFRYMQATQTNMWKEQIQSQQIVVALAQRTGMQLSNQ